jgi:predicted nucleic acid-binding protein
LPTVYYLDTSALVKNYVQETGTAWVQQVLSTQDNENVVSRVVGAELVAALVRRLNRKDIAEANGMQAIRTFQEDFRSSEFGVFEVTEQVVETAMRLALDRGLRGYDSVQLATALEVQQIRTQLSLDPVRFISADDNLNSAAEQEGLLFENPNNHRQ